MAAYTLQNAPHAGLAPIVATQPAVGNTNTAPCGQDICLVVKNGSGSPITVTILVPAVITYDGLVIPNRTLSVAATSDGMIPLVASDYLDPATGLCLWGVSANTTVLAYVITTTS